jgi:hypothetical protein
MSQTPKYFKKTNIQWSFEKQCVGHGLIEVIPNFFIEKEKKLKSR